MTKAIGTKKTIKKGLVKKAIQKPIQKPVSREAEEKFVAHSTGLNPGMRAPDFRGLNQEGKEISLSDYRGKKLILYFYPKDDTESCTAEACNLEENISFLKKDGYKVVGVSGDDVKSHKKFANKYKLSFDLLADTEMKALKAYDVWGIKKFMGRIYDGIIRTTFIIDEQGVITEIIRNVKTKEHVKQITLLR
jgi:peroxiredoxin Q/BCP